MSAVSQRRQAQARRRRRRHGGALLAALAYGVAGFALYQLVVTTLDRRPEASAPVVAAAPGATVTADLGTSEPREELALRAVAARVQQSVYAIRIDGRTRGSAAVGWISQGKISFLLTARAAVAGAGGDIFLRHARRTWPARVVRSDAASGLAVLRVNEPLSRPLWQSAANREGLRNGLRTLVVPSGKNVAFARGRLTKEDRAFSLDAGGGPRYLGAPLIAADGRPAGVVIELLPAGRSRVVGLTAACRAVRTCR